RGHPARRDPPVLAPGGGDRRLPGRVQAGTLGAHGVDRGQAGEQEEQQRRKAGRQFGGEGPPVAAGPPAPPHLSARSMTAVNADCTLPEVSTLSRMPAKATAASVPTAYSAVFIPASP